MAHDLQDLRQSLDNLDNAIIYLFAERFRLTQKVGEYKRDNKLPPVDPAREREQFKRVEKLAVQAGLDPEFAKKLLRTVIDEVVCNHKALQNSKKTEKRA